MSSENGWIWWNYRTDLKEYYLVVTYEYCFSTRKDYFPLKQKIPETRFNQVLNKIEEIASRYYTRKLSSFLSVQLVSYNDCTPEQKYTLKLYDKKYRELNYIENSSNFLIAEVLTAIEIIEELDKEEFENGIIDVDCETVPKLESASAPADNDSSAIPAAVASVPFSGDLPAVADYSIPVSSVASRERVTSKTVEVMPVENDQLKVLKQISKKLDRLESIENGVYQTASNAASINIKTVGKITRVKDIPPYNPTDKCWVDVTRYSEITGLERASLDSARSRSKDRASDDNSGIHGEHCWRRVNGTIFYYVYQSKYLDLL